MLDPVVSGEEHARLKERSVAVFKNGGLFPVAVAFGRLALTVGSVASAPEIGVGLGGRLHPRQVLEALLRLSQIGAVAELPHPGAPSPRVFERKSSPFWSFVDEYCFDQAPESIPAQSGEGAAEGSELDPEAHSDRPSSRTGSG